MDVLASLPALLNHAAARYYLGTDSTSQCSMDVPANLLTCFFVCLQFEAQNFCLATVQSYTVRALSIADLTLPQGQVQTSSSSPKVDPCPSPA